MLNELNIKEFMENHRQFVKMCNELVDYAKLHNLSKDIIFDGVAWSSYDRMTNAYEQGVRQGRADKSAEIISKLDLL